MYTLHTLGSSEAWAGHPLTTPSSRQTEDFFLFCFCRQGLAVALNSWSSYFSLVSAGITDVHHHAWFRLKTSNFPQAGTSETSVWDNIYTSIYTPHKLLRRTWAPLFLGHLALAQPAIKPKYPLLQLMLFRPQENIFPHLLFYVLNPEGGCIYMK
jgi:hypothetical protein